MPRERLLSKLGLRAVLLLLAPTLLFIFFMHFLPGTDPDYWWHVRTGQYIYETGAIPTVDIYSYTAAGKPWVAHEWLSELMFYVVQRQLGYVGNVALFGLLSMLTWLAVYATCRRRGIGELSATALMIWGYVVAMGSINVRPQMLTALLLAVAALLLTRYKQGQPKPLWALPPLFALWVNLHGGYVIGLALVVLTVGGEALSHVLRRPAAPIKPLAAIAVFSAAATMLNPNGVEALLYPFSYAGTQNASMQYIAEWQSPDFHASLFVALAASLLLAIVLGIGRRPLGISEVLWTLAFGFMALQSARHVPLYAVVIMPLLAARIQAEIPALRNSVSTWKRPAVLGVTWLMLAAIVLATLADPEKRSKLQLGYEPSSATYPAGAVEYLRVHNLEGNLFNDYGWGGYLIYQLYPERRVFIDGRADVYGDAFVGSYIAVHRLQPNWRQVLEEHGVPLALVGKDSVVATVLSADPAWREVYAGEVERLFVREAQ